MDIAEWISSWIVENSDKRGSDNRVSTIFVQNESYTGFKNELKFTLLSTVLKIFSIFKITLNRKNVPNIYIYFNCI